MLLDMHQLLSYTRCCFKTLPFAYDISVQINYSECWIVIPYKTNSPHFITWVITYKNVKLVVKIFKNLKKKKKTFLILNWTMSRRWTSGDVHEWFTVYVCCMFSSNMYCDIVYCTVVHRSTQREFMFVVNKGVFFSFAQCSEQIRIAKTMQ